MGVTENAGRNVQLRIRAQITRNYARNLFIDEYTINFIACNTKKSVSDYNLVGPSLVGAQVASEIVREVGQNIVSVDVNTA